MSRIALTSAAPPVRENGDPYLVDIVKARKGQRPFRVLLVSPRRVISSHATWEEARDWTALYGAVPRQ